MGRPKTDSDVNIHTFLRAGTRTAGLVLGTTLVVSSALAADGTVVYDSTSNRSDTWVSNISPTNRRQIEIGDEISLAGSARMVTSFVFEYFGDIAPGTSPGANAVVRFYANDGGLHVPSSGPAAPMPQTLLWESAPFQVLGNKEFREVTLSVPNIVVPDKITWSIQFNGLTGASQAGLTISDPVTVGAVLPTSNGTFLLGSYSDYWGKTDPLRSDSWALFVIPPNRANFHAKLTAVPEPGAVALFAAGGVTVLFLRRRQNG